MEPPTPPNPISAALRSPIGDEQFAAVFEYAGLGICLLAPDGTLLRANRKLCEMHGYTEAELIGRNAHDLNHDRGAVSREATRALLEGRGPAYTAQRQFVRRNGDVYPVQVSVSLVRPEGGEPYFISIVEDLTAQAAAQRRIRQQAEMLDRANDAIMVHQIPGRMLLYWNQGAERLFGWKAQQAVGRTFADLVGAESRVPEEERLRVLEHGQGIGLVRCRAADGRMLDVERRFTLIRDEQGQPTAVLSVNTDVTDRLRAQRELEALNAVLEERIRERTAQLQESIEELRTFAYSLAHDLRGPLAAIDGFSHELARRLGDGLDERSRHYLQRIRGGVRQMSDLTDAILSLTRLSQAPLQRESVDLSALARAWHQRMRDQEPRRNVDVCIDATPHVQGDVRLLGNVLENLLGNAWKFTARQDEARIEFSTARGDAGQAVYVVRDNGAGFDPRYADRLFMPFQRLHGAGEFPGTGIGLAMVRKIVHRHGGRIWVEAREGAGASFYFTIGEARPEPAVPGG